MHGIFPWWRGVRGPLTTQFSVPKNENFGAFLAPDMQANGSYNDYNDY
jgi:hypothetical protein